MLYLEILLCGVTAFVITETVNYLFFSTKTTTSSTQTENTFTHHNEEVQTITNMDDKGTQTILQSLSQEHVVNKEYFETIKQFDLNTKSVADNGVQTDSVAPTVQESLGEETLSKSVETDIIPTVSKSVETDIIANTSVEIDSIAEYPVIDQPILEPTILPVEPFYKEIGVETGTSSLWEMFREWFIQYFHITPSEFYISDRVNEWRNDVNSLQFEDSLDNSLSVKSVEYVDNGVQTEIDQQNTLSTDVQLDWNTDVELDLNTDEQIDLNTDEQIDLNTDGVSILTNKIDIILNDPDLTYHQKYYLVLKETTDPHYRDPMGGFFDAVIDYETEKMLALNGNIDVVTIAENLSPF